MGSLLGWVDFEEKERNQMMEVIKMMREQDTRDELGIGVIRDAFSDMLFPGTSTIQTRAKYMLFVPWLYRNHERKKTPSAEIAAKARRDEMRLCNALLKSEDTEGVIGKEAGSKLQRLPSNVYWSGLRRWGIRYFPGSHEEYHQFLNNFYIRQASQIIGDDREPVEGPLKENWDPNLPECPAGFPDEATLKLFQHEAEYLKEKIMKYCSQTVLAHLVTSTADPAVCNYIWEHPQLHDFPDFNKTQIKYARSFSLFIHGAFLLYNYMLACYCKREDLIEKYQEMLQEWATEIMDSPELFYGWQGQEFWEVVETQIGYIPPPVYRFVNDWLQIVFEEADPFNVISNQSAWDLIRNREIRLKKTKRARLANDRALELWTGASGIRRLDFRWNETKRIVNDILEGLNPKED